MPSIKSRIVRGYDPVSPITSSTNPIQTSPFPYGSTERSITRIAINRGIPPEQYMYAFEVQDAIPARPTYRRAFPFVNTAIQNLALQANAKANTTTTK